MKQLSILVLVFSAKVLAEPVQGPVSTGFVTSSDGTLIAVHESGPRDGKPIIFLHGWSSNSEVWFEQRSSPALSRYRIIGMDLRGHGDSGKPADPNAYAQPGLMADDVNAVIQQLHLERPVLAGWSVGGGVAMEYLQKYGQSAISGLDLIGSVACPNTACEQQVTLLTQQNPFLQPLSSNDAPTIFAGATAYENLWASGFSTSSGPLTQEQQLIVQEAVWATPAFVRQNWINGVGAAIATNFGDVLAHLTVPVLLQSATNDMVYPPQLTIPIEEPFIKNHTVKLYPIGGHLAFIIDAEPFNNDLAEWLETLQ